MEGMHLPRDVLFSAIYLRTAASGGVLAIRLKDRLGVRGFARLHERSPNRRLKLIHHPSRGRRTRTVEIDVELPAHCSTKIAKRLYGATCGELVSQRNGQTLCCGGEARRVRRFARSTGCCARRGAQGWKPRVRAREASGAGRDLGIASARWLAIKAEVFAGGGEEQHLRGGPGLRRTRRELVEIHSERFSAESE
jgi:hypothetical protein